MKKGFTLIELLAVIVILAIIALIATPIVLSIIGDSKESSGLRSAEMYLNAVEQAVAIEKMNNTSFNPNSCNINNGNLECEETDLKLEVKGEVPSTGSITFEGGKLKDIVLTYKNGKTIVKDSEGKLVYGSVEGENNSGSGDLDMSTVSATLEDNSWETIQQVVSAGRVTEAGWRVGDTKKLEINGQEKTATIIGLDHDGENTATFMIMSNIGDGQYGGHVMNSASEDYKYGDNIGGWEASEMRAWLNGEIYESMSNKDQIIEVTKYTNNIGKTDATEDISTGTQDKVFLLSVKEIGLSSNNAKDGDNNATYEWFESNSLYSYTFWLRSPDSSNDSRFFYYDDGDLDNYNAYGDRSVYATFVIG